MSFYERQEANPEGWAPCPVCKQGCQIFRGCLSWHGDETPGTVGTVCAGALKRAPEVFHLGMQHPAKPKPPAALAKASDEQLLEELARRHAGALFVGMKVVDGRDRWPYLAKGSPFLLSCLEAHASLMLQSLAR